MDIYLVGGAVRDALLNYPVVERDWVVGGELPDPVGPEFALVAREISLGLQPGVAMANLQDRLDCQDLPVFVTAVLVQLETGGNLAETLENLSNVLRGRRQLKLKIKALSSEAKASAYIIGSLPFVMGVLIYMVIQSGS